MPGAEPVHLAADPVATCGAGGVRRHRGTGPAAHGVCRNRELLLAELPGIGFEDFSPVDGAFYIYTNVSRFSNDSFEFAQKMLKEAGVAATPGADFDDVNGAHYLRLSFAGSTAEMEEAVTRLRRWLG